MPERTTVNLPRVEPIVPVSRPYPFNDPAWLFEPKYDGFRGVLYLTPGECHIRSRNDNVFARFAALACEVQEQLEAQDAILDGEVVAVDAEGRHDFRALLAGKGSL